MRNSKVRTTEQFGQTWSIEIEYNNEDNARDAIIFFHYYKGPLGDLKVIKDFIDQHKAVINANFVEREMMLDGI
ncbi:MAG: hypothetical protein EZS28_001674 [Streblomastix strix]|uniref:Uncharacterized protein n=1 Tax=Streblomastix strix TaxID=222440 RepID=A0A5J4X6J6_9EUKA|nr:MAG: hypothetical protein EZS28_001674 [Streblomastix strix]